MCLSMMIYRSYPLGGERIGEGTNLKKKKYLSAIRPVTTISHPLLFSTPTSNHLEPDKLLQLIHEPPPQLTLNYRYPPEYVASPFTAYTGLVLFQSIHS